MSDYQYPQQNPPGEKSPNGTLILIFGILGILICAPFAIVAWVMGNSERKNYPHDDMVKVGWILGIVGTCLIILGILIMIGFFLFGFAMYSASDIISMGF